MTAYRFAARSTTPGEYRLALGTLELLIAAANVRKDVDRGDGAAGTYTFSGTVTAGDPVLFRCLEAATNIVTALALSGVTVAYRKLPWDRGSVKPGIWLCPAKEAFTAATNEKIGVEYPIDVVMVRASNQHLTDGMETFTGWRQKIRRAFTCTPSYQPILDVVTEAVSVRVEAGPVYDPACFGLMHDVGVLRVIVTCHEGGEA